MGIGFLGIGFQPKWAIKDIPIMPKVLLIPLSMISELDMQYQNVAGGLKNKWGWLLSPSFGLKCLML